MPMTCSCLGPITALMRISLSLGSTLRCELQDGNCRQVLPALSYPNVVTMYGVVLTVMGMFIAWPAPACNNPVFAEIVPPPMRNMVYGACHRTVDWPVMCGLTTSVGPRAPDVGIQHRVAAVAGQLQSS